MKKVFIALAMVLLLTADCFAEASIDFTGTDYFGKSVNSKFAAVSVDEMTGTILFDISGGCPSYNLITGKVYLDTSCIGSSSDVKGTRTSTSGFGVVEGDELWVFTSSILDGEAYNLGVLYYSGVFVFRFNPKKKKNFELVKFWYTTYASVLDYRANDWRWAVPEPDGRVFYKLNITD